MRRVDHARAGSSRRLLILGALVALLANLLVAPGAPPASALSGSDFRPGYIISDALFYSSSAMTEQEIQAFLAAKIGTCQSASNFCLNVYKETMASRARVVSDRTGNVRCEAFQGGADLSAATIIYRVQVACGISAKVILVTLQKEQALVTATNPSQAAMDRAMGYGCPDTAPCATSSLGFGNQIYTGAVQLRTYKASVFGMQPGNHYVAYNPNADCGGSTINIENYATAALYNYTPYQPNTAALANLGTAAPPCGSYGNRNFWVFYSSWFGPTSGPDGAALIAAEYAAQGGPTGTVGTSVSGILTITQNGGGLGQAFQNASIYWSVDTGAKTVRAGPLRDYYFGLDGAAGSMGWPALNQGPIAENGGGVAQLFTGGSLYSSASGTFLVKDPIRSGYFSKDGASGILGWPKADQVCATSNEYCSQVFQGGVVYWSTAAGSYALYGAMVTAYQLSGGPTGPWGLPSSSIGWIPQNGGGVGQVFTNGSVYVATGGGAQLVSGGVRDYYFGLGGAAGSLGFPTADGQCLASGSCSQAFQHGSILWSPTTGGRVGSVEIEAEQARLGGDSGTIGRQLTPLLSYPYNGGGLAVGYAGGSIYWKQSLGAFGALNGPIRDAFFAQGGVAGTYGWPKQDAQCGLPNSGCSQAFEGATIFWTPATGAFGTYGAIGIAYAAAGGGGGTWGWPSSSIAWIPQNGGGVGQVFTNGSVYVATGGGAQLVSGGVRDYYFGLGGAAGSLGFPTAAGQCLASGSCSQAFQHGSILWSPTTGGSVG